MKRTVLPLLLAVVTSLTAYSAELEKLVYPTAEDASFVIQVPSDWELEQAEEAGEYFHITSPSDAVFSFRTIKGTKDSLNEAIDACVDDMSKMFNDLKLGEAQDWNPNGLTGIYTSGTAKDKEDGTALVVGLGWCALADGKIAEFWFVADADDAKGIATAEKIANSLTAP